MIRRKRTRSRSIRSSKTNRKVTKPRENCSTSERLEYLEKSVVTLANAMRQCLSSNSVAAKLETSHTTCTSEGHNIGSRDEKDENLAQNEPEP